MINPETQQESEAKLFTPGAFFSKESKKHPGRNEDTPILDAEKMIGGVLDGVGGGMAGEQASHLAKEVITKKLAEVKPGANTNEWARALAQALEAAHQSVFELSKSVFLTYLQRQEFREETGDIMLSDEDVAKKISETGWRPKKITPDKFKDPAQIIAAREKEKVEPTGTTASVFKIVERPDGTMDLVYGQVGDSRIYILNPDGTLEQITQDQGAFEVAVGMGLITREEANALDQTTSEDDLVKKFGEKRAAEVMVYFQFRNQIAQGVGFDQGIRPKIGIIEKIKSGAKVLATSDGIHDNLTNEEIRQEMIKGGSLQEITQRLVAKSRERAEQKGKHIRAKHDDMTAVIFEVPTLIPTADIAEEAEEIALSTEDIEMLEAEDNKESAEKIKEIKRAIGM